MGGDWVWYLGAVVLGAGALWLIVWAWWGDRARGRARCGRCWYSMEGLARECGSLPVCPECGWRANRKGQLFRARPRKWWVAAAVVLALGAVAIGLTPNVRRDGAWSVVPTWAMWIGVWGGYHSDEFARELCDRYEGEAGRGVLAERVYRWTPSVRLTRDTWVRGVPLRARLGSLYSRLGPSSLSFAVGGVGNSADVASIASHENWWTPGHYQVTPNLVANEKNGLINLSIATVDGASQEVATLIVTGVRVVDRIEEVMAPVELSREKVLGAIGPSMFVLPTTENLALSVSDASANEIGEGVVLGVKAEVVRRGEVIARARWYQSADGEPMAGRPILVRFGEMPRHIPPGQERLINGPMTSSLESLLADGCVVRFSTDVEMALCAFECDRYWKGSFEVPLKELVK